MFMEYGIFTSPQIIKTSEASFKLDSLLLTASWSYGLPPTCGEQEKLVYLDRLGT